MQIRDRVKELRRVRASTLRPHPANWRTHPAAQRDALKGLLAEVGYADALLARELPDGSLQLVDGHLRAETTPDTDVPVLVLDVTEAEAATILATLDPLAAMAQADAAALDALLAGVRTDSDAVAALLADTAAGAAHLTPAAPDAESDAADDALDADADEDGLDLLFQAPFPWFGGKARVAGAVWARLGDVANYVEPFFGSGAVFLNRPPPVDGVETVNDADGMVSNFWRAVQADPDAVAGFADWPVNENDLHARHAWLVGRKSTLQPRLEGDPDFFDARVAGWWC